VSGADPALVVVHFTGHAESEIESRAEVEADLEDPRVAWVLANTQHGRLRVPRDRWWPTIEALVELSNVCGDWADHDRSRHHPEGERAHRGASLGFSGAHTRLFRAGRKLGWVP
jgi:hypothetical protein